MTKQSYPAVLAISSRSRACFPIDLPPGGRVQFCASPLKASRRLWSFCRSQKMEALVLLLVTEDVPGVPASSAYSEGSCCFSRAALLNIHVPPFPSLRLSSYSESELGVSHKFWDILSLCLQIASVPFPLSSPLKL